MGPAPLSWAAGYGHLEVVKISLERDDVNPGQADTKYGWTPLQWADINSKQEVVNILFAQKDLILDQADTQYD